MFGALRTIGTVLTVAAGAKFGKEQYDKYRDAKRKRQVEEVNQFIKSVDLDELQKAIKSEDVEVLVDSVESIIAAAHDVRERSAAEDLREDLTAAAEGATEKVMGFFDSITDSEDFKKATESFNAGLDKASAKLDEVVDSVGESIDEMATAIDEAMEEVNEAAEEAEAVEKEKQKQAEQPVEKPKLKKKKKKKKEAITQPTFNEFMNGVRLAVTFDDNTTRIVTINCEDIMINPTKKMVQVPPPAGSDFYVKITLK